MKEYSKLFGIYTADEMIYPPRFTLVREDDVLTLSLYEPDKNNSDGNLCGQMVLRGNTLEGDIQLTNGLVPEKYELMLYFWAKAIEAIAPYTFAAVVDSEVFTRNEWAVPQLSAMLDFLKKPGELERTIKQAPKVIRAGMVEGKSASEMLSSIGKGGIPSKVLAWASKQRASAQLVSLLQVISKENGNAAVIFQGYVNSLKKAGCYRFYNYKYTAEQFYENIQELLEAGYKTKPLLEYLIRQSFYYGTFEGQMAEAIELRDYVRLANGMHMPYERFPSNVYKAHNILVRNSQSLNLSDEDLEKFTDACKKAKKYELTISPMEKKGKVVDITEDYCVVIPDTPEDVVAEGNALSHCVAGYVPMIAAGETIVGFLRLKSAPKTPLYTIEISGNKVIQAKGQFDADVPDDIAKAIRRIERSWAARR